MLYFLLSVIVFAYGIFAYLKGDKKRGFIVYFLFITSFFYIGNDNWYGNIPIRKTQDFALLYMMFVFCHNVYKTSFTKFFRCHTKFYRWIFYLFIYITIEFIFTLILDREEFSYSLKTYRRFLPLLTFYLLQQLKFNDLKYVIRVILSIVLITVFLHILQPVFGITLLNFSGVDSTGFEGSFRYRNIPTLIYPILFLLTITFNSRNKRNVFFLCACLISLAISQWRSAMIAYALITVVYLFLAGRRKLLIRLSIVAILLSPVLGTVILKRFNNDGNSTGEDIKNVATLDVNSVITSGHQNGDGTFIFRALILLERVQYLTDNPKYLISGIGVRHEDSPRTHKEFNFKLGSDQENPSGEVVPAQIGSPDMAWLNPLMLFGLIGVFLYVKFTIIGIKYLYHYRKYSSIVYSAFLYYLLMVICSLTYDDLFGTQQIIYMMMMVELVRKARLSHRKIGNIKLLASNSIRHQNNKIENKVEEK